MTTRYRSWDERRQIISAIIADGVQQPLSSFDLSQSEEIFFRARSRRAVDRLAQKTSTFKAYYALKTSKPFRAIAGTGVAVTLIGVAAFVYLYLHRSNGTHVYTLMGSCAAICVAAVGWCVAGWIAHRNAVRQNTTNLIFARFSQSAFTDSLHRFHAEFGYDASQKLTYRLARAALLKGGESAKGAEAANYLLSYYEFIAAGVIRGDLDCEIVRDNVRGIIVYYYDKCEPYILQANAKNRRAFENLMKIRTHYREP